MEKLLQDLGQSTNTKKKAKVHNIVFKDENSHEGVDNFFKSIALKNKPKLEEFNKHKEKTSK